MRTFVVGVILLLLLSVCLFPPMEKTTQYLDAEEAELVILPIWQAGEWTSGQVTYTAEVDLGLLIPIAMGLAAAGVLSWMFLPSRGPSFSLTASRRRSRR